jgi:hypothetical protein
VITHEDYDISITQIGKHHRLVIGISNKSI